MRGIHVLGFMSFFAFVGAGVAHGQMFPDRLPGPCPDDFATMATFKLRFVDGSTLSLGGFSDPNTIIGRSDRYEAPYIQYGLPQFICGGGSAQYPGTAASFPPTCRPTPEWHIFDSAFFDTITGLFPNPFNSPYRARVATEILSLNLQNPGAAFIRAGQPYYASVTATPQFRFFRQSTGEVASRFTPDWPDCNEELCCPPPGPLGGPPCQQQCSPPCYDSGQDFDCTDSNYRCVSINPDCNAPFGGCYAASFFNVFVEVDIPAIGKKAYNKTPLVLRASINSFPPNLALPNSAYLHDPDFGGVALFDQDGLPFAWLISAGHGGSGGGFPTDDSPLPIPGPAAFTVDLDTTGLDPLVTMRPPNHVFADQASVKKRLTVYSSSGANPNSVPDMSNARDPILQPASVPPAFQSGDAINSFTYGRDGAAGGVVVVPSNPEFPIPPLGEFATLFFSVSRTSAGETCTDVNYNYATPPGSPPEQAADIYASRCKPFGRYDDGGAIFVPLGTKNLLVGDGTFLGLRPLIADADQDNLTGLELKVFDAAVDFFFATFTGPSFSGPGDQATIYVLNAPAGNTFEFANLTVFAAPPDLGLVDGDVIDALALSDTTAGEPLCSQQPSGVLNSGGDEVLFSLAPGSPSLSGFSPADVFYSSFNGAYSVFRYHHELGLLPNDDVDALDIRGFNSDPAGACCFGLAGCRFVTKDDCTLLGGYFLGDGTVCLGDSGFPPNGVDDACECHTCRGDLNRSGIVNYADVRGFVAALLGCNDFCADTNMDGVIDGRDVQPFVNLVIAVFLCP